MPAAIRCENLGKSYRIDRAAPSGGYRYRTLRDDLIKGFLSPLRRMQAKTNPSAAEEFWALRDVNFEIDEGEVVGIIGRNGAGKSTLLKILSRITKPTTGRAELCGRVGSLLEVGTGFHPELTGRENIYLNGAILGMRREEISRQFDAIVDFAEIEQFLETPVKRYSSGMYVRLAFAVAAHLQPEILIVDEVLAVGDVAFQRKCMGRMREVGSSGRTVLFVSHNMPAIESLCTRAVWLDAGRFVRDGEVSDVVHEYHQSVLRPLAEGCASLANVGSPTRSNKVFQSASLLGADGCPTTYMPLGGRFHLRIGLSLDTPLHYPTIGIGIDNHLGHRLLTVHTPTTEHPLERLENNCYVDCQIEKFPLAPGDYWVKIALSNGGEIMDEIERAIQFTVIQAEAFDEGRGWTRGACVAPSTWHLVPEKPPSWSGRSAGTMAGNAHR
jgi:lipopolysaccharide transport system ATP-binding protein